MFALQGQTKDFITLHSIIGAVLSFLLKIGLNQRATCYMISISDAVDSDAFYNFQNNTIYVDDNCSTICSCTNNTLSCNRNYECSSNATCKVKDGLRKCYCNNGFEGDGETCTAIYRDCFDAYQDGHRADIVYTIFPSGWEGKPFNVSCDMTNGGWTVSSQNIYTTIYTNYFICHAN